MSNPRNVVAFDGIDQIRVTYLIDNATITYDKTLPGGSAGVGLAVKLSGNATVALAADGDAIEGRLESVERDLKGVVTVEGFVHLPAGTGAALTPGKKCVGALLAAAPGYIREVGSDAEAAKSDAELIDSSVATSVIVDL